MKLVYAAPWIVMACSLMGRVARCDEREQREAYLRMAERELPADSSWFLQEWRAILHSLVDERDQAVSSIRQASGGNKRRIAAVAVATMEISRGNLAAATQAIEAARQSPKIDGTRAHYCALLLADAYQAVQQDAQALDVLRRAGETPSADLLALAGDIKGALRSLRARKIDDQYEYVLHDTARIAVQLMHRGRVGDAAQMIADLELALK